jgi:hypothetical protein
MLLPRAGRPQISPDRTCSIASAIVWYVASRRWNGPFDIPRCAPRERRSPKRQPEALHVLRRGYPLSTPHQKRTKAKKVPKCRSSHSAGTKGSARASPARRALPGLRGQRYQPHALLMAIFFSLFCASGLFGSVTVSTPFLKCASILSASTPSGTPNERWKEP